MKVEDIANITIKHRKGHFSNLHLDYVTRIKTRITEIAGTRGKLLIDISNRSLKFINIKGKIEKNEVFKTEINSDYSDEVLRFYNYVVKKN